MLRDRKRVFFLVYVFFFFFVGYFFWWSFVCVVNVVVFLIIKNIINYIFYINFRHLIFLYIKKIINIAVISLFLLFSFFLSSSCSFFNVIGNLLVDTLQRLLCFRLVVVGFFRIALFCSSFVNFAFFSLEIY